MTETLFIKRVTHDGKKTFFKVVDSSLRGYVYAVIVGGDESICHVLETEKCETSSLEEVTAYLMEN